MPEYIGMLTTSLYQNVTKYSTEHPRYVKDSPPFSLKLNFYGFVPWMIYKQAFAIFIDI